MHLREAQSGYGWPCPCRSRVRQRRGPQTEIRATRFPMPPGRWPSSLRVTPGFVPDRSLMVTAQLLPPARIPGKAFHDRTRVNRYAPLKAKMMLGDQAAIIGVN